MISIKWSRLWTDAWVRLALLVGTLIILLVGGATAINYTLVQPIKKDLTGAKHGVTRIARDVERLKKDVAKLDEKMKKKSMSSNGKYQHYYTLYTNPLRYINQFILTQAKPDGLVITNSSVVSNTGFNGYEKKKFAPHAKRYGISRTNNLNNVFSVARVTLRTSGSFNDTASYLVNLYAIPIDFFVTKFSINNQGRLIVMDLEISFMVYRMGDT
ncbi:MAG: hypothetical protein ACO3K7_06225 [Candidatus Marinamargulisbacteria bacterium]